MSLYVCLYLPAEKYKRHDKNGLLGLKLYHVKKKKKQTDSKAVVFNQASETELPEESLQNA